jgi:hypothetical protein
MVVGRDSARDMGDTCVFGLWEFERVQHFTYLGLRIDQRATPSTIVTDLLSRASRALGVLCEFIGS